MAGGTKRKAAAAACEAPGRATLPAARYNPLRDRIKLTAAVRTLAEAALQHNRTMTAMTFCREVLSSLGLHQVAVGQAERIFISAARKVALGARDAEIIIQPGPAIPVAVPSLRSVAAALSGVEQKSCGPHDHTIEPILPECLNERLARRLDVDQLRSRSLVHLESFLNTEEIALIARNLAEGGASDERVTALRESSGTGRNGAYGDVHVAKVPLLRELKTALKSSLCQKQGNSLVAHGTLGDKVVVTRYAEDGINYAHQDQRTGGYQAYLLLSRPGVDFCGGQLYIIDPEAIVAGAVDAISTRQVEWKRSGDLVIFAANAAEAADCPKNWLHGFREISTGCVHKAQCHLCVVGVLE
ncbi:MAG: hypothetical protein SGPRY_000263 [Prymnesium sp.]